MQLKRIGNQNADEEPRRRFGIFSSWKCNVILFLTLCVMAICLLTLKEPLYAFFSDKTEGSFSVNASELGAEIKVESVKLLYGKGNGLVKNDPDNNSEIYNDNQIGNIYSSKYIKITDGGNTGITLSDGYILPIRLTLKNTGKTTADLIPQITISWANWVGSAGINLDVSTAFKLYPASVDDSAIFAGEAEEVGSFSMVDAKNAVCTGDTEEKVARGDTKIVEYKLYFPRNSDNTKKVTDAKLAVGTLTLTSSVSAVLPDKGIGSTWKKENVSEDAKIITNIYSNPFIEKIDLQSDNHIKDNNKVAVDIRTLSSESEVAYPWKDTIFPYEYEAKRNDIELGGDAVSRGRIKVEDTKTRTFIDGNIDWLKRYSYEISSYDDYGRTIGSVKNNTDACEGGLVSLPDEILREEVVKPRRIGVTDTTTPVTINNFIMTSISWQITDYNGVVKPEMQGKEIKNLEGLQHVSENVNNKGFYIYLDGNDLKDEDIMGKMPASGVIDLSFNDITGITSDGLKEITKYSGTLQNLYLNRMGITNIDFLKNPAFTRLKLVGLSNNMLSDVSALSGSSRLEHIDLRSNTTLEDVNNLFGYKINDSGVGKFELEKLTYYNLTGCPLNSESEVYIGYHETPPHGNDNFRAYENESIKGTTIWYRGTNWKGTRTSTTRSVAPSLAIPSDNPLEVVEDEEAKSEEAVSSEEALNDASEEKEDSLEKDSVNSAADSSPPTEDDSGDPVG